MPAILRPVLLLAGAGFILLSAAAIFGGVTIPGILDRVGSGVLWALPLSKFAANAAGAVTLGSLLLVLFVLPAEGEGPGRALHWARVAAMAWTVSAGVHTVAGFQLVTNQPTPFGEIFASGFLPFLTQVDAGRLGLITVFLSAGIAIMLSTGSARPQRPAVWTAGALAVAAMIPLVLNSHATGGADHADNTTSIVLHVVAASAWIGGLAILTALHRDLPTDTRATAVGRYSAIALVCFVSLGLTGLVTAWATVQSPANLATPYGLMLAAKVAAFVLLGVLGAWHRNAVVARLRQHPAQAGRLFGTLAMVELAIMGGASGLAAVLARTETPSSDAAVSEVARGLPAPVMDQILSQWQLDPWWVLVCSFAVLWYLRGVRQIRREQGDWPAYRTAAWLAGISLLFVMTNAAPHAYQGFIFSAHVLTQMMLTAVVPLLLVPAAPLELARRTVGARMDGTFGGRELADGLRTRLVGRLTAAPYSAAVILALTFVAFYYTPLLAWSARSQLGYGLMSVVALAVGCLMTSVAGRTSTRGAVAVLLAAAAVVFAVYGWALQTQAAALELPWYSVYGRLWADAPAADPARAGPLVWVLGAAWMVGVILVGAWATRRAGQPRSGHSAEQAVKGLDGSVRGA